MPDRLTERFSQLADEVRFRLMVPAEAVRARGNWRRRRDTAIATTAVAMVIGTVGVLVGLSLTGGSGQLSPATRLPVPTAFPAEFTLPHQGEPGWTRSDDPLARGVISTCGGTDVTLVDRVAAATITGSAPPEVQVHSPTTWSEQVLLFDSAPAALTALHALADQSHGCRGWASVVSEPAGGGGQTFLMMTYPGDRSVGNLTGVRDAEAIAEGNVLILHDTRITGALMSGSDPDGVVSMVDSVCSVLGVCPTRACPTDLSSYAAATPCPMGVTGSGSGYGSPSGFPVTSEGPSESPVRGSPGPVGSSGPAVSLGPSPTG